MERHDTQSILCKTFVWMSSGSLTGHYSSIQLYLEYNKGQRLDTKGHIQKLQVFLFNVTLFRSLRSVMCRSIQTINTNTRETAADQRSNLAYSQTWKWESETNHEKNTSKGVSLLSLLWGTASDITADLNPLTGAAPINLVYIYTCLGLTDTRRSYWLKWEPFGLEQHQWIIRVSSSNLEGPCVLEMNQVPSLPNHLVLWSKNHIFL